MGQEHKDPRIGQKIGPYTIREKIASGGMGVVYKAYEPNLDRIIALKLLPGHMCGDDKFRQRFLHEARSAAKLEHAGIVPVYSAGEDQGDLYIAMQFVRGKTFADLMDEDGVIPTRTALEIIRAAAAALDFAHQRHLIHRDIKPDNIMIDTESHVKIMDFGLAKLQMVSDGLTQSGLYLGTPEYSSPEQCETHALDGRTDIYSLGVVLYEALTGGLPHTAETPLALFHKVTKDDPTPIRMLNSRVPVTVQALVAKMMAKKVEDRYQAASEVVQHIDKILEKETFPVQSGSKVVVPRQRRITPLTSDDSKTIVVRYDKEGNPYVPTRIPYIVVAAVLLLSVTVAGMIYNRLHSKDAINATDISDVEPVPAEDITADNIPQDVAKYMKVKRVAVMNFENWSQDSRLDWIELALQEMITTSLSGSEFVKVVSRSELMKTYDEVVQAHGDVVAYRDTVMQSLANRLDLDLIITGKFLQDEKNLRVDVILEDLHGYEFRKDFSGSKERMVPLVNEMGKDIREQIEDMIVTEAQVVAEEIAKSRQVKDASGETVGHDGLSDSEFNFSKTGEGLLASQELAFNWEVDKEGRSFKVIWPTNQDGARSSVSRSLQVVDEGIKLSGPQGEIVLKCDGLSEQVAKLAEKMQDGELQVLAMHKLNSALGRDVEGDSVNYQNFAVLELSDSGNSQDDIDATVTEPGMMMESTAPAYEMTIVLNADATESELDLVSEELCDEVIAKMEQKERANLRGHAKRDKKKTHATEKLRKDIMRQFKKSIQNEIKKETPLKIIAYMQKLNQQCKSEYAEETISEFLNKYKALSKDDRQNLAIELQFRAMKMYEDMSDEPTIMQLNAALGMLYRALLFNPETRKLPITITELEEQKLQLLHTLNSKKVYIGVHGENVERGVKVERIIKGMPAFKAGMKYGDIILNIDTTKIANTSNLFSFLATKEIGDVVEVTYLRNGKELKTKIALAVKPIEVGIKRQKTNKK